MTPIEDAKVLWVRSRMRAMSQARTPEAATAIAQEWWCSEPYRNPWIASEVEQFIDSIKARWAKQGGK